MPPWLWCHWRPALTEPCGDDAGGLIGASGEHPVGPSWVNLAPPGHTNGEPAIGQIRQNYWVLFRPLASIIESRRQLLWIDRIRGWSGRAGVSWGRATGAWPTCRTCSTSPAPPPLPTTSTSAAAAPTRDLAPLHTSPPFPSLELRHSHRMALSSMSQRCTRCLSTFQLTSAMMYTVHDWRRHANPILFCSNVKLFRTFSRHSPPCLHGRPLLQTQDLLHPSSK